MSVQYWGPGRALEQQGEIVTWLGMCPKDWGCFVYQIKADWSEIIIEFWGYKFGI